MNLLKKGVDKRGVLLVLLFIVGGTYLLLMGPLFKLRLTISRIAIPQGVVFLLGGVTLFVGSFFMKMGLAADKCVACDKVFEKREAWFFSKELKEIIEAVKQQECDKLESLEISGDSVNTVVLQVHYCPSCFAAGKLIVESKKNSVSKSVFGDQVVSGEMVRDFATIAIRHEAARGR